MIYNLPNKGIRDGENSLKKGRKPQENARGEVKEKERNKIKPAKL